MQDADRVPVIIGIGQINDRNGDEATAFDSQGLMIEALRIAEADAGGGLLTRLDWLGVVEQISFPDPDIHEHVADDLPVRPSTVIRSDSASGEAPISLLNEAANSIGRGEVRVAAVVGGEALRTAANRVRAGTFKAKAGVERLKELGEKLTTPLARRYGLGTPSDVYPLYENAARAAWGQSLAEAQAETGQIWAHMSQVAAQNDAAWLRSPVEAEVVAQPSPDNRMISFPYTKLMVANSSVNQGAAVLITSLAVARELDISDDRIIYIGQGAAASEPTDYLKRDDFVHTASLEATLGAVLERNAISVEALDHVELYSCFPCVPKMARRVLGRSASQPSTVYGGLTFGGGPIANCMTHAVAAMVEQLRAKPGSGLIVANGGFATYNHAIMLSSRPVAAGAFPHDPDVQDRADALRGAVPALLEYYEGPGSIETFAVPFDREGRPQRATVIGRTPDGERFLADVPGDDQETLEFLTSGASEPVGSAGVAVAGDGEKVRWVRRSS